MAADPKPVVDVAELRRTYENRVVLDSVSFTVHERERVGLVGNNGSGKSTLARILAGAEPPDGGRLSRRRDLRIDYLAQEPALPAGRTIREVVLGSLASWNAARERYERATAALERGHGDVDALVQAQAQAGEELERHGGWERAHEAEDLLGRLGLRDPERDVAVLSGGERRRVDLARLLVGAPDLAILDEPTNHLDVGTIEWLEEHLLTVFAGALLLVTHDRYVLDRVTTRTLELHHGRVTSYPGGYVAYLEAKAERAALAERTERNRQNFLRRELEWLRRGPKARTTKQKARVDRVEAVRGASKPVEERTVHMRAQGARLGKTILVLEDLRVEREGRTLVSGLDLHLGRGDRIGIIGPNGTGKTSFLLCVEDRLAPSAGSVRRGENTKSAYLDQMRSELDETLSVREAVAGEQSEVRVGDERIDVGSYLERFLFDRTVQRQDVRDLSGGERARVCLARLLAQNANLLLLDEPTNDLDVSTLGALESMLTDFDGCALVVSHDRWFLDRTVNRILAFEGEGRAVLHAGTYSEYRARVGRAAPTTAERRAKAAKPKRAREDRETGPRKLTFAEQRELDGLLDEIDTAESRVREIETVLADPETYRTRGDDVSSLQRSLRESQAEVARRTARWEELEEKKAAFESARAGRPGGG